MGHRQHFAFLEATKQKASLNASSRRKWRRSDLATQDDEQFIRR
jgi:hypothetical protein